jgi:catechol 2,3-dioxygenase-like lactoylglutathione lyase family enzyme
MHVHHVALRTRDVDRLEGFYVGVLGFRVRARHDGRSVWLDADGTVVMIERAVDHEPHVPAGSMELIAFCIQARDREPWRERLAGAGVGIEDETPHTLYFRDPDGRRVGLSSYPFT